MNKNNDKNEYIKSNDNNKEKVSLEYNLELERKDSKNLKDAGYDYVPRFNHWTNIDEQKLKVAEIENKTRE